MLGSLKPLEEAKGDNVTPPVAVPKVVFSPPAHDFELFVNYDSKRHQLLSLIQVWVQKETQM